VGYEKINMISSLGNQLLQEPNIWDRAWEVVVLLIFYRPFGIEEAGVALYYWNILHSVSTAALVLPAPKDQCCKRIPGFVKYCHPVSALLSQASRISSPFDVVQKKCCGNGSPDRSAVQLPSSRVY